MTSAAGTLLTPFAQAFDAWEAQARHQQGWRSEHTPQAYRRIWQPFVQWCVTQQPPLSPHSIAARDLEAYVLGRSARDRADEPVTARYAWRVLTVVDHVLQHAASQGATGTACTAVRDALLRHPDWRWANAPENERPPDHLDAASAAQLLSHLARARRVQSDTHAVPARWQDVRDAAVVALHLGGGATPAEARSLKVTDLLLSDQRGNRLSGKVRIPASLESAGRETPLAAWAQPLLAQWTVARRSAGIGGDWLFCATRSGKPWSADGHALAVRRVLEAAGLEPASATGAAFRLRHTFALRQLRRGAAEADVASWLGVKEAKVMARYRRVLDTPPTDVI